MKKYLALALALIMALCMVACSNGAEGAKDNTTPTDQTAEATVADKIAAAAQNPVDTTKVAEAANAGTLKIGVILVGDENEGYTYAHIEGIEEAKAALGLSDDQVIYKYSIPENEACYDTAVDLAEQGCSLIFSNSFSHETYMIQAAEEYSEVIFLPATGQQAALCGLDNVVNYFPPGVPVPLRGGRRGRHEAQGAHGCRHRHRSLHWLRGRLPLRGSGFRLYLLLPGHPVHRP